MSSKFSRLKKGIQKLVVLTMKEPRKLPVLFRHLFSYARLKSVILEGNFLDRLPYNPLTSSVEQSLITSTS